MDKTASLISLFFEQNRDRILTLARAQAAAQLAQQRDQQSVPRQWKAVNSLSHLRALVGGRLSILRSVWQEAGFALQKTARTNKQANCKKVAPERLLSYLEQRGFSARYGKAGDGALLWVLSSQE